jgi:hypothetical protein
MTNKQLAEEAKIFKHVGYIINKKRFFFEKETI